MAYKDKDKQREANRQAAKKYRDSMTDKGMTVKTDVIPKSDIPVIPKSVTPEGLVDNDKLPANYGQSDYDGRRIPLKTSQDSSGCV